MHDLTFAKEIINRLQDKLNTIPKNVKITAVNAVLSPLSHVRPNSLIEAYKTLSKGTDFENIAINVGISKLELKCRTCQCIFFVDKPTVTCIKCSGSDLDIVSEKEFLIKSIEIKRVV